MSRKSFIKTMLLIAGIISLYLIATDVFATSGIGAVASQARKQLSAIAQLITAGSYVAGMGFAVGAVVKFKGHKDNPTQQPIGVPIALLFIGAALIYIPSVFSSTGASLFASGNVAGISGITSFTM